MALVPVILPLAGAPAWNLLVTTPEEEEGARRLLQQRGESFETVRI